MNLRQGSRGRASGGLLLWPCSGSCVRGAERSPSNLRLSDQVSNCFPLCPVLQSFSSGTPKVPDSKDSSEDFPRFLPNRTQKKTEQKPKKKKGNALSCSFWVWSWLCPSSIAYTPGRQSSTNSLSFSGVLFRERTWGLPKYKHNHKKGNSLQLSHISFCLRLCTAEVSKSNNSWCWQLCPAISINYLSGGRDGHLATWSGACLGNFQLSKAFSGRYERFRFVLISATMEFATNSYIPYSCLYATLVQTEEDVGFLVLLSALSVDGLSEILAGTLQQFRKLEWGLFGGISACKGILLSI